LQEGGDNGGLDEDERGVDGGFPYRWYVLEKSDFHLFGCSLKVLLPLCGIPIAAVYGFPDVERSVLCDESGQTKFPFSYVAHVTLLTPAQDWLRLAQSCSPDTTHGRDMGETPRG